MAERFLTDLREAVEYVKGHPEEKGSMAPVYGMAATIPMRGMVSDLLKKTNSSGCWEIVDPARPNFRWRLVD